MRIVLLLVEICTNNEKYEDAYFYIEKYNLHSDSPVLKPSSLDDNTIRMSVVEDFLKELYEIKSPLLLQVKSWRLV